MLELHIAIPFWSTWQPVALTALPELCSSNLVQSHQAWRIPCSSSSEGRLPASHTGAVFYQGIYGHCEPRRTTSLFKGSSCIYTDLSIAHNKKQSLGKPSLAWNQLVSNIQMMGRYPLQNTFPCWPSSSSFSLLGNLTSVKRKSFVCEGPCPCLTKSPGKNDHTFVF